MKYIGVVLFAFLCITLNAQNKKFGFEFGGFFTLNEKNLEYVNQSFSPGGYLGFNVDIPISNKFSLNTGVSFFDHYYKLEGEEIQIYKPNIGYSGRSIEETLNNYGVSLPILISWNKYNVAPLVGIKISRYLSNQLSGSLYNIDELENDGNIYKSSSLIDISPWSIYGICGVGISLGEITELKLQYGISLNSFVKNTRTPLIINTENIDGTIVDYSKINQLSLSLVVKPNKILFKDKSSKQRQNIFQQLIN